MKTTKMSLANIQGKLSRTEMKNIMAGSGSFCKSEGSPCGPNGATCMYENTEWNTESGCCCTDDDYNDECLGA